MITKLGLSLIILSILCIPAFGQTIAKDWLDKNVELYGKGMYDEAIQALDAAQAIQALDAAIALNPNDARAWLNKGEVLMIQGKYDEAIQAYDEATKIIFKGLELKRRSLEAEKEPWH